MSTVLYCFLFCAYICSALSIRVAHWWLLFFNLGLFLKDRSTGSSPMYTYPFKSFSVRLCPHRHFPLAWERGNHYSCTNGRGGFIPTLMMKCYSLIYLWDKRWLSTSYSMLGAVGGKTSKTWYLPLKSRRGDLKANDHNTVLSMLTDKCTAQQGTREKRGPLHVSGA